MRKAKVMKGPGLGLRKQEFGSEDSPEKVNREGIQKQGNLEKCCCEINSRKKKKKKKPEWNVVHL